MDIRPRPDGATIVLNGKEIGHVGWSLTGEDEVIISGEPLHVIPWAHGVAAELGAEFAELPAERW